MRVNENLLEIQKNHNWQIFAELPDVIEDWEYTNEGHIIVKTAQRSNKTDHRNIFLLDKNGHLIWQIEKAESLPDPFYPNRPNAYCGFKWEDNRLTCFTQGGFNYEVELATGKIKQIGFSKW